MLVGFDLVGEECFEVDVLAVGLLADVSWEGEVIFVDLVDLFIDLEVLLVDLVL